MTCCLFNCVHCSNGIHRAIAWLFRLVCNAYFNHCRVLNTCMACTLLCRFYLRAFLEVFLFLFFFCLACKLGVHAASVVLQTAPLLDVASFRRIAL